MIKNSVYLLCAIFWKPNKGPSKRLTKIDYPCLLDQRHSWNHLNSLGVCSTGSQNRHTGSLSFTPTILTAVGTPPLFLVDERQLQSSVLLKDTSVMTGFKPTPPWLSDKNLILMRCSRDMTIIILWRHYMYFYHEGALKSHFTEKFKAWIVACNPEGKS